MIPHLCNFATRKPHQQFCTSCAAQNRCSHLTSARSLCVFTEMHERPVWPRFTPTWAKLCLKVTRGCVAVCYAAALVCNCSIFLRSTIWPDEKCKQTGRLCNWELGVSRAGDWTKSRAALRAWPHSAFFKLMLNRSLTSQTCQRQSFVTRCLLSATVYVLIVLCSTYPSCSYGLVFFRCYLEVYLWSVLCLITFFL